MSLIHTKRATYGGGRDVREIGGNTRTVNDIIKNKLVDERTDLQQKR